MSHGGVKAQRECLETGRRVRRIKSGNKRITQKFYMGGKKGGST
jgi:hypothetical protein